MVSSPNDDAANDVTDDGSEDISDDAPDDVTHHNNLTGRARVHYLLYEFFGLDEDTARYFDTWNDEEIAFLITLKDYEDHLREESLKANIEGRKEWETYLKNKWSLAFDRFSEELGKVFEFPEEENFPTNWSEIPEEHGIESETGEPIEISEDVCDKKSQLRHCDAFLELALLTQKEGSESWEVGENEDTLDEDCETRAKFLLCGKGDETYSGEIEKLYHLIDDVIKFDIECLRKKTCDHTREIETQEKFNKVVCNESDYCFGWVFDRGKSIYPNDLFNMETTLLDDDLARIYCI